MTTPATSAIAALDALGPLAAAGLRLNVVAPDGAGELAAYQVRTSDDARDGLAAIAEDTRTRLLDATLLAYEPATPVPASHAMYVPIAAAATLAPVQSLVDTGDTDAFDAQADYAQRASMVAARFSIRAGTSVTFYRVREPLLQFGKRKLFGLVYRGGTYDALGPADVLLMRAQFDVVVIEDHAFFFNPTTFEHGFGFLEQLQRTSAETFDRVTEHLRIAGFEELRVAATSNRQMMQMMSTIRQNMEDDPDYAAAMTMPRLARFLDDNPGIGIEVSGRGDDQALVFDPSPKTRFGILHLLRDDYLRSVLTEREYEVNSKVRRTT